MQEPNYLSSIYWQIKKQKILFYQKNNRSYTFVPNTPNSVIIHNSVSKLINNE